MKVARYASGLSVASPFIAADAHANKDGKIDILDALKIAQYAAGII
jgi:hypothetical protein